jgi:biotin carboxylase
LTIKKIQYSKLDDHQKTIMMIGGGIQEVKAVQIAQSSGYKVIVTDRNKDAPCFAYADYAAVIDGRDIEALIAYTLLNQKKLNIVGVFTLTELVTSVAVVATAAGLPSVSLSSVVACQNKNLCKQIWIKNNIPTPRGGIVHSYSEAKILFNDLQKKVFVKPEVGFGGISSRKILTCQDLKVFFENVNQGMIIEELLEGSMHDVNGVFDNNGKFHPMGIVDRFFMKDFPVEQKISTPSTLSQDQQIALYDLLEKSVKVLGIDWGPVKGDAILFKGKFYMLEVAPRLHGPKNSLFLLPYSGFDCLTAVLNIINGSDKNYINKINQNKHCICIAILPKNKKEFGRYINEIKNNKNIKKILILNEDMNLNLHYENNTDVPAYLFITGKDLYDCNQKLNTISTLS